MEVITGRRMNNNDFVHKYLTTEACIKTYSYVIYPIPDETQWPQVQHVEVLLPIEKKLPERPKKNRKRGANEPIKRRETLEIGVETVVNSAIMLGAVNLQLLRVLAKLRERGASAHIFKEFHASIIWESFLLITSGRASAKSSGRASARITRELHAPYHLEELHAHIIWEFQASII
ncbi:hypothetical protein LWI29_005157 [Acer saccharum]|uniref:Uncharacterized protein n=1 Tax=Acer saccharum TaxID=4024 RepID=A0AA39VW67_ACESA|nr:hypothetical protein LWI29_005157 [Acer saccharum]